MCSVTMITEATHVPGKAGGLGLRVSLRTATREWGW